jgi:hypothetical protein
MHFYVFFDQNILIGHNFFYSAIVFFVSFFSDVDHNNNNNNVGRLDSDYKYESTVTYILNEKKNEQEEKKLASTIDGHIISYKFLYFFPSHHRLSTFLDARELVVGGWLSVCPVVAAWPVEWASRKVPGHHIIIYIYYFFIAFYT